MIVFLEFLKRNVKEVTKSKIIMSQINLARLYHWGLFGLRAQRKTRTSENAENLKSKR